MGREVRMVPADWEHPKDKNGNFIPLFGRLYTKAAADWDAEYAQWESGLRRNYVNDGWEKIDDEYAGMTFTEWNGRRPSPDDHMPEFAAGTATHLMMYETCTEGTPISPAFKTPEELARWLADNNADSFGSMSAPYEQWLAAAKRGWSVSAIPGANGLRSGVEM